MRLARRTCNHEVPSSSLGSVVIEHRNPVGAASMQVNHADHPFGVVKLLPATAGALRPPCNLWHVASLIAYQIRGATGLVILS